jgi:hypothetical protein
MANAGVSGRKQTVCVDWTNPQDSVRGKGITACVPHQPLSLQTAHRVTDSHLYVQIIESVSARAVDGQDSRQTSCIMERNPDRGLLYGRLGRVLRVPFLLARGPQAIDGRENRMASCCMASGDAAGGRNWSWLKDGDESHCGLMVQDQGTRLEINLWMTSKCNPTM